MPKIEKNVLYPFTYFILPKGTKSFQVRNKSNIYTVHVSTEGEGGLGSIDDRYDLRPLTTIMLELDPNKKDTKIYVGHNGGAGNYARVEITPFLFYGVRGIMEDGDLNPTRPYDGYFEHTAVNDNVATLYTVGTLRNETRIRDIMIECIGNDVLIGFDENAARPATGHRVVAGTIKTFNDVSVITNITGINQAMGNNFQIIGHWLGD